jgi:4-hydroxythreonine-4-phosphate dehydrogenase
MQFCTDFFFNGYFQMNDLRPIVGVTMGDPVGVGSEIILSALSDPSLYDICRPVVFGDLKVLQSAKITTQSTLDLEVVKRPDAGGLVYGRVDILNISDLDPGGTIWGKPTVETGKAMVKYITEAVDMAMAERIGAVVTCPINKKAMQQAGFDFQGHTELLARQTETSNYAMMLAGSRLRVVPVTIHTALKNVPDLLSEENILRKIKITARSLNERFGIKKPRIAVSALNPHAGESGMFGNEEKTVIRPAVETAREAGIDASGPFAPDTLFYHAEKGRFDAVVCMYHDQGLIPFKMIHFHDGVNTTLGLPIIRTSVDHGTAYDIAGSGAADPGSLTAAVKMAAEQVVWKSTTAR